MKWKNLVRAVVILTVMVYCASGSACAQVTEVRQGESNPSGVLFHSTLYGAGTGLVLGGAYALVKKGDNPSTGSILSWSIAGGAALGFLVGVIYLTSRPQPRGLASSEEGSRPGRLELLAPSISLTEHRKLGGGTSRVMELSLLKTSF